MKIVRGKRRKNFTIMSNKVIYDDQLSYRALGLLTYLLSKPDGWETDSSRLSEGRKEGRDAVRTAMTELKSAGYLVHRRVQDRGSGRWATVAELTDEPEDGFPVVGVTSENTPSVQVGPTTGKPTVGYPDVGKPGASSKDADQELTARTRTGCTLPPDPLRPEHAPRTPNDHGPNLTAVPHSNDHKRVTSQTRAGAELRRPLLALIENESPEYVIDVNQLALAVDIPPPELDPERAAMWPVLQAQLARINHLKVPTQGVPA